MVCFHCQIRGHGQEVDRKNQEGEVALERVESVGDGHDVKKRSAKESHNCSKVNEPDAGDGVSGGELGAIERALHLDGCFEQRAN